MQKSYQKFGYQLFQGWQTKGLPLHLRYSRRFEKGEKRKNLSLLDEQEKSYPHLSKDAVSLELNNITNNVIFN